jgi:hypothetical protein
VSTLLRDLLPPVRAALRDALIHAEGREESYVWKLFETGIPKLREVLRPTYGHALSINGVFCHGHPRAHFMNTAGRAAQPEIGDLLIVVHHLLGNRRIRRSILLQLKMTDKRSFSRDQEELYRDWPPFEFSYRRRRTKHHVVCGEHRGAQYGFIDRNSRDITIAQRPHPPAGRRLGWEDLLATELLAMLTIPAVAGRSFATKSRSSADPSGWSPVVWDLLQNTFSAGTYKGRSRVLEAADFRFLLEPEIPRLVVGRRWREEASQLWQLAQEHERRAASDLPDPADRVGLAGGPLSTMVFELDWRDLALQEEAESQFEHRERP